jgi:hypothetical protein
LGGRGPDTEQPSEETQTLLRNGAVNRVISFFVFFREGIRPILAPSGSSIAKESDERPQRNSKINTQSGKSKTGQKIGSSTELESSKRLQWDIFEFSCETHPTMVSLADQ